MLKNLLCSGLLLLLAAGACWGFDVGVEAGAQGTVFKLELLTRPGEKQWVRIEKQGNQLKFVPSSQVEASWFDHPMTRVTLTLTGCEPASQQLLKTLQEQKARQVNPEQYAQARRQFLASVTTAEDFARLSRSCVLEGVDTLTLPAGYDLSQGAIISLEFYQVNKLWKLTFDLAADPSQPGRKLVGRLLSASP